MKVRKWTAVLLLLMLGLLAVNWQPRGYSYRTSELGVHIMLHGEAVGFAYRHDILESAKEHSIEELLQELGIYDAEDPAAVYVVIDGDHSDGRMSYELHYEMDAQFRHEIFLMEDCLYDLEMYVTGLGQEGTKEVADYFTETVLPDIIHADTENDFHKLEK